LIIAVKKIKVSDFGGRSLSANEEETKIYLNPEMPEAHLLDDWCKNTDRALLNWVNISQARHLISQA